MLFIEALTRTTTLPNEKRHLSRPKQRPTSHSHDSVDLSPAAHEVKEVFISSDDKNSLTASSSIFANVIEHVLSYIYQSDLFLRSPEELDTEIKAWRISLQVPPTANNPANKRFDYTTSEIQHPLPTKQVLFYIPVKPAFGLPIDMTLSLSTHNGSPKHPYFFQSLAKENPLPVLRTPYPPDFLSQQVTHYRLLIDQDGEPDQLSVFQHLNQNQHAPHLAGLRVWRIKNNRLTPVVLGDINVGLVFVGHYNLINTHAFSEEESTLTQNRLNVKA